ncbi:MAG: VIT family protein [Candidatus Saccharimonadales bacterium]
MTDYETPHPGEAHKSQRSAWLRAAVLGANDGIVSVSSLMLGVAAAAASEGTIMTTGIAGLAAGALSMAMGEYVSVASQRDSEQYDIAIERRSIEENPKEELAELAYIYEQRGLEKKLAMEVARQLNEHDAVGAHARDELGIDHDALAKPVQAASASAVSFSVGAVIPILAALLVTGHNGPLAIVIASLAALGISGAIGAYIGGGHKIIAAARVFLGGGAAMAITAFIGHLIGSSI